MVSIFLLTSIGLLWINHVESCGRGCCSCSPKDCQVTQWSMWSNSCVYGLTKRTRSVVRADVTCGGRLCRELPVKELKRCSATSSKNSFCGNSYMTDRPWRPYYDFPNEESRVGITYKLHTEPTASYMNLHHVFSDASEQPSMLKYNGKKCGPDTDEQECVFSIFCNFETDMCLMQETSSWYRKRGSTSSWDTGPSSGQGYSAFYSYLKTTYTPFWSHHRLTTGPVGHVGIVCADFYYHMYGSDMGALQLVLELEDGIGTHVLWSSNGDQGNIWKHAQVTVNITNQQQNLTWVGIVGGGMKSEMAVDTISMEGKTCSSNPDCLPADCSWGPWSTYTNCSETNTKTRRRDMVQQAECGGSPCSGNAIEVTDCCYQSVDCKTSSWTDWSECSVENNLERRNRSVEVAVKCNGKECNGSLWQTRNCTFFACDFEELDYINLCRMDQQNLRSEGWKGLSRSYGRTHPPEGQGSSSSFLYLKGLHELHSIWAKRMSFSDVVCVSFYYKLFGEAIGPLQLSVSRARNSSQVLALWAQAGQQGQEWLYQQLDVQVGINDTLGWAGVAVGVKGTVAIDTISISKAPCSPSSVCTRKRCKWQEWTPWSDCEGLPNSYVADLKNISGIQQRRRSTLQPAECGGAECQGIVMKHNLVALNVNMAPGLPGCSVKVDNSCDKELHRSLCVQKRFVMTQERRGHVQSCCTVTSRMSTAVFCA